MNSYKEDGFVKRIRVKGHSRKDQSGRIQAVSPHYRIVRKLRASDSYNPNTTRRKLI